MKKLVLVFLMFFGLAFGLFARQRVSFWTAMTEEERQDIFGWCQLEISLLICMGYHIDCVSFTDYGYFIVYEDYE